MQLPASDLPDLDLWYDPVCFPEPTAQQLLNALTAEIPWRQEEITLFGRRHLTPRLSAWMGDPGAVYTYSRLRLEPLPWSPLLLEIRHRVEAVCHERFNSVLLNLYRDGQDSMGWHSDDEPELGPEPVIASVSLGQVRPFLLRHRTRKGLRYRIELASGSLLVMRGPTQQHWQHHVPKSRRSLAPRLNLTFRRIQIPDSAASPA